MLRLTAKTSGYLRTDKTFKNYHLHAEWRWPQTAAAGTNNSGIFIGQRPPDAVWPYSVQVQLKEGSAGDLIAQGGVTFTPASAGLTLKKIAAPKENPDGEWNSADIYCRGTALTVFINGLKQNSVDHLSFDSGQIALQLEGYPVEFRNVWLQPLCAQAATPLEWSVCLARSQIEREGKLLLAPPQGPGKWDYTTGLYADALIRLGERTGDPSYEKDAEDTIGSFVSPDGKIATYGTDPAPAENQIKGGNKKTQRYSLDNIQSGVATLRLYDLTRQERYRAAADLLREQLKTQPRVREGGFWHKLGYPNQMWLDGLYMAEPFYARYAARFHEPADFDDVARQFTVIAAHTYNPATGLFFHGWDESKTQPWANPQTGASPTFWSRSIGWYAMALVDVLDTFPADHPARPALVALLQKVGAGLVRYQDPVSGVWWQVTDQGGRPDNYLEASASCMFVYALAKGVNEGFLPRTDLPAIRAGYQGLIRQFVRFDQGQDRISLTRCCEVAILSAKYRGSYEYYTRIQPIVSNDLKGVGPFITAGLECDKLFGSEVFQAPADDPAASPAPLPLHGSPTP